MPVKNKDDARLYISIKGDEIKILHSELKPKQLYKMLLGVILKVPFSRQAMQAVLEYKNKNNE